MLGKVFKHEMKSTSKLFLPLILGFIIITALCKFSFEASNTLFANYSWVLDIITTIFFTLYFIYIIALYVMTSVFIVIHFYKTMVGNQGYLTHTLPVKTSTLINAKLLAAILWEVIAGALFLLSILLFALGHFRFSEVNELIGNFKILFDNFSNHINLPVFFIEVFIVSIFSLISGPITLYASIGLGHLFRKHRVLWAVISYFLIYIIMQVISTFAMGHFVNSSINSEEFGFIFFKNFMVYTTIFTVVSTTVLYIITNYIFSKRLNLE